MSTDGIDGSRVRLVRAAVAAFSARGYEGVSLREIERLAGVNRGLVAHHFGTKERIFQEAVDHLLSRFHEEIVRYEDVLADLPRQERVRILLRILVRFSARSPDFYRLVILTGNEDTDSSRYLFERIRPTIELLLDLANEGGDRSPAQNATFLYMVAGAIGQIFAIPNQCRALFGVDPTESDFVEQFADTAVNLFQPLMTNARLQPPGG